MDINTIATNVNIAGFLGIIATMLVIIASYLMGREEKNRSKQKI